jgi:hypothetical protein
MVSEDCPQSHGSSVQNRLVAETAQALVPMNDLDLLPDDDISKNRKE